MVIWPFAADTPPLWYCVPSGPTTLSVANSAWMSSLNRSVTDWGAPTMLDPSVGSLLSRRVWAKAGAAPSSSATQGVVQAVRPSVMVPLTPGSTT